jgi:hypothetical protein
MVTQYIIYIWNQFVRSCVSLPKIKWPMGKSIDIFPPLKGLHWRGFFARLSRSANGRVIARAISICKAQSWSAIAHLSIDRRHRTHKTRQWKRPLKSWKKPAFQNYPDEFFKRSNRIRYNSYIIREFIPNILLCVSFRINQREKLPKSGYGIRKACRFRKKSVKQFLIVAFF